MSRKVSEAERDEFRTHLNTPRPLKAVTPKPKTSRPRITKGVAALDGNTAARLKDGKMAPQARIDLHGMTEARAHDALLAFLMRARTEGVRLALVVTGVGNPKGEDDAAWMRSPHGVLKQMAPRWLNEKPFAALIAGYEPAHIRHGGEGALYVYLRKLR